MEFNSTGTNDKISIENFLKDLNRSTTAGYPYPPAPGSVVLDATDFFVNIFPDQLLRFLFSLLAVKPESKYNGNVLIFCPAEVKLFEQGRKNLCRRSGSCDITHNN